MSSAGYQFGENEVRRIAAAVRRVEGMLPADGGPVGRPGRPVSPRPRKQWYRLVTNEGGGEYTARLQQWDDSAGELVDVADADHPEYGLDQPAWDRLGSAAGYVDERVAGWRTWAGDQWVLLVDVPHQVFSAVVLDATTLPSAEASRVVGGAPHIDVVTPDGAAMIPGPTRAADGTYQPRQVRPMLAGWQVGLTVGSPWDLASYHATSYAGKAQITVAASADDPAVWVSSTSPHALAATLTSSHASGLSSLIDATIHYATGDLAGQLILLGGGPYVAAVADVFWPPAASGDATRIVWSAAGWRELLYRVPVRVRSTGEAPYGQADVGYYDGGGGGTAGLIAALPPLWGPDSTGGVAAPALVDANGNTWTVDYYGRLAAVAGP